MVDHETEGLIHALHKGSHVRKLHTTEMTVGPDLFISYAWTSGNHRDWVRLLAGNLKAFGWDVLIDAHVKYGDSLSGFMHRVIEARHVLMIADPNYVERADNLPDSGVGIENRWISEAHSHKPATWLSVLFKDNPTSAVPAWLSVHKPKGHWFNSRPDKGEFPGSEQIEDLWRWIEDLPSNREHATTIATLRERAVRLERIDVQRDPAHWRSPAVTGEVHFPYAASPLKTFWMGQGTFEFAFKISDRGNGTIAVYADPIKAVGLLRSHAETSAELAVHLSPGRVVDAGPGSTVVLMNNQGTICVVDILEVQPEVNDQAYIAPYINFRYRVLLDS